VRKADFMGWSDPLVIYKIENTEFKTEVCKGAKNPTWNYTKAHNLDLAKPVTSAFHLMLIVSSHDRRISQLSSSSAGTTTRRL
jgi:Ca2+-dependent lipid-binding protein